MLPNIVVFCAVHVSSKENMSSILPRNYCNIASVAVGKCWDSTSIMPRPISSKYFPNIHLHISLPFEDV
jgi:hypothetical protein